ncbi:hypothetical protein [Ferrimonas senticii]|uniref:hypothetical protein n=1 Tax=Ferrimonas senticii TaxID=394566 RepID=UPI0012EB4E99|nr:hypothetical protein [Ferrimonas senticii]
MKKILLALLCVPLVACQSPTVAPQAVEAYDCSPTGLERIERYVDSSDGRGHGPDIGSLEWYGSIEHRLKIKQDPQLPPAQTEAWCHYLWQHYLPADASNSASQ